MLSFKNFISLAALVGAFNMVASAAPTAKRQTPATCSTYATASLAVRPKGSDDTVTPTWVGIVKGTTNQGIDGQQASILVTKDDNGNPLQPQAWEFADCTSLDANSTLPSDFHPSDSQVEHFGILRPAGATQHCLALESTQDSNVNDRNSVLDSRCTDVDAQYRTWFMHGAATNDDTPQYLEFANEPMYIVISGTQHAELQFFSDTTKDAPELEMVLINPQNNQAVVNVQSQMAS